MNQFSCIILFALLIAAWLVAPSYELECWTKLGASPATNTSANCTGADEDRCMAHGTFRVNGSVVTVDTPMVHGCTAQNSSHCTGSKNGCSKPDDKGIATCSMCCHTDKCNNMFQYVAATTSDSLQVTGIVTLVLSFVYLSTVCALY